MSRILVIIMLLVSLSAGSSHAYWVEETDYGNDPVNLFNAVNRDDMSVVLALINSGQDINETGTLGYTPLMQAVENENIEIMSILLENKADVNISTKYGLTALKIARKNSRDLVFMTVQIITRKWRHLNS